MQVPDDRRTTSEERHIWYWVPGGHRDFAAVDERPAHGLDRLQTLQHRREGKPIICASRTLL